MLRRRPSRLLLLLGLALAPALAAAPQITLLYDTEFGGYVPVVGGIERPDLAIRKGDGRAPEKPRVALRRAKRGAKKGAKPEVPGRTPSEAALEARRPTRRWLAQTAITTEILVLDTEGRPIEGAHVYRFHDPTFYAVNQDSRGARLFDSWRLMPAPFPAAVAAETITAHEEEWQSQGFGPVAEITPNMDERCNPFVRPGAGPAPSVEHLGRTGPDGRFVAVSGLFNLRDRRRFPRAIVPDALRLGFVITADGFLPASDLRRFAKGGVAESRTLQLLDAPSHPVFTSGEWRVVRRIVEGAPLDRILEFDQLARDIEQRVDRLVVPLTLVDESFRDDVRREAEARLWRIVIRRVPDEKIRLAAARRVAQLTPKSPGRLQQFATLVLAADGVRPGDAPPKNPISPSETVTEAEQALQAAITSNPRFLPPYPLLDQLLLRRGASIDERRDWVSRLLKASPFDQWGRARMSVFMLRTGRNVEAFDNLRYTYMAIPGIGGDRELALTLSGFYWKIGLPEKAGAYAWLLTGRPPEDPTVRPKEFGS